VLPPKWQIYRVCNANNASLCFAFFRENGAHQLRECLFVRTELVDLINHDHFVPLNINKVRTALYGAGKCLSYCIGQLLGIEPCAVDSLGGRFSQSFTYFLQECDPKLLDVAVSHSVVEE
jgi:hypothetical protein